MTALEAFYKEVNASGNLRLSSTLLCKVTTGQSRQTHQDPAVDNEDFILF